VKKAPDVHQRSSHMRRRSLDGRVTVSQDRFATLTLPLTPGPRLSRPQTRTVAQPPAGEHDPQSAHTGAARNLFAHACTRWSARFEMVQVVGVLHLSCCGGMSGRLILTPGQTRERAAPPARHFSTRTAGRDHVGAGQVITPVQVVGKNPPTGMVRPDNSRCGKVLQTLPGELPNILGRVGPLYPPKE
jgi:hypothetical protein